MTRILSITLSTVEQRITSLEFEHCVAEIRGQTLNKRCTFNRWQIDVQ